MRTNRSFLKVYLFKMAQKLAYIAKNGAKLAKWVKNGPISNSRKDREILNRICTPAIWW